MSRFLHQDFSQFVQNVEKRLFKKQITGNAKSMARFLKEQYLPYREEFIKRYEPSVANLLRDYTGQWRRLLFPFKDSALRAAIYKAMDRVLGRRHRLYDLRLHFSSYLSLKKVPGQVIDILQGRTPPSQFKVLAQHYLAFTVEDLKAIYDEAELTVIP